MIDWGRSRVSRGMPGTLAVLIGETDLESPASGTNEQNA
jgi:hypothetical protein